MIRRILTTTCILIFFTVAYSLAATIYSNGTGGRLWNETAIWIGGVVPVEGDEIIVFESVVVNEGMPNIPKDVDVLYSGVGGNSVTSLATLFNIIPYKA